MAMVSIHFQATKYRANDTIIRSPFSNTVCHPSKKSFAQSGEQHSGLTIKDLFIEPRILSPVFGKIVLSDGLCRCVAPKETSLVPKATSQRAKTMPSGAFVTSSEAICAQNDFIKMALLFHHYHRQRATYVLGMGASALGRQTTSIARKLIQ